MPPAHRLRGTPIVSDVMHRFFVTAAPHEPLAAAHQTMRLARLRHLLVAEETRLLGIASYRDVTEALLGEATRWLRRPAPAPGELEAGTLQSVMTPRPAVVSPSTPLTEAAEQLCRHRYGCLPVVEEEPGGEGVLVGVLTEVDVLRAALGGGWRPAARPRTRAGRPG